MSAVKVRHPAAGAGSDGEIPAWLRDTAFSEDERSLYFRAARRSGLEVTHWARQVLNRTAREMLDMEEGEPAGARLAAKRPPGARNRPASRASHPKARLP